MKKQITMISFDTALKNTGYSVYKNCKLTDYGSLKTIDPDNRLDMMIKQVNKLLNTYRPDICVVETTAVLRNAKIQRLLSELIGGIRFWSVTHDAFYHEFYPNNWRKLVSDDNEIIPKTRADLKKWSLSKVTVTTNDDNVSDAILIGQAYINLICETKGE